MMNFFSFQGHSPFGSPGTWAIKCEVLKNPIVNMVAEKLGKTPAQVALRWGLQMGHSVLPKSANEARIKENFDVFDWSIPEDLFAKFSEIEQASSLAVFLLFMHCSEHCILLNIVSRTATTSCHWSCFILVKYAISKI
jgi:diketogulonate reductase-like aldo/keto reductase